MANQTYQVKTYENIYDWADALDGRRVGMGLTFLSVHRKMREIGSTYAYSTVSNIRMTPSEKLLAEISSALDALASERENREEGVFTTNAEVM